MVLSKVEQLKKMIYDFALDLEITDSERQIILKAKSEFDKGKDPSKIISNLKMELAPLGLQQSLSPKVLQFYLKLQKEFPVRDKMWRPYGMFF